MGMEWIGAGRQGGMKDISEGSSTGAGLVGLVSVQPPMVGKNDGNFYVNKTPIGAQPCDPTEEVYHASGDHKAGKSARSGPVGPKKGMVPGADGPPSSGGKKGLSFVDKGEFKVVPCTQLVQNIGKMAPIYPPKKGSGESGAKQIALQAPLRPSLKGGKLVGGQPKQQQFTPKSGKSGMGWVPPPPPVPQSRKKGVKNLTQWPDFPVVAAPGLTITGKQNPPLSFQETSDKAKYAPSLAVNPTSHGQFWGKQQIGKGKKPSPVAVPKNSPMSETPTDQKTSGPHKISVQDLGPPRYDPEDRAVFNKLLQSSPWTLKRFVAYTVLQFPGASNKVLNRALFNRYGARPHEICQLFECPDIQSVSKMVLTNYQAPVDSGEALKPFRPFELSDTENPESPGDGESPEGKGKKGAQ